MSAFYIMISVSMLIAFAFLGAFVWSVKKGHYDDDFTPSVRILMDDAKVGDSSVNEPVSSLVHTSNTSTSNVKSELKI